MKEKKTMELSFDKLDKLEIHSAKPFNRATGHILRTILPDDSYDALKEISFQTGLSIENIIRRMIEFSIPYTEVIE